MKRKSYESKMEKFCRKSHIHGLDEFHEYYWQKKNRLKSYFWIAVFVGAFALMSYSIYEEISDYIEAPIITSYHIHESSQSEMELPLIELCPSHSHNRFFTEIRVNQTWRTTHIDDITTILDASTYRMISMEVQQMDRKYFAEPCLRNNGSLQCPCHWSNKKAYLNNHNRTAISQLSVDQIGCPILELPINITFNLCINDVVPIGTVMHLKCSPYHQMFTRNFRLFFDEGIVAYCHYRKNASVNVAEWQYRVEGQYMTMPYLYCLPAYTPTSISDYWMKTGYTTEQLIQDCAVLGPAGFPECQITRLFEPYHQDNCFVIRAENGSIVTVLIDLDPMWTELHKSVGDDAFFKDPAKTVHDKYIDEPFIGYESFRPKPNDLLAAGIELYLHSHVSFVPEFDALHFTIRQFFSERAKTLHIRGGD